MIFIMVQLIAKFSMPEIIWQLSEISYQEKDSNHKTFIETVKYNF